ncbi:MAG: metallophosphoesterase [Thermoplasmatales archaeon]|nr:metallophosphoesterase [Thermoplasmatales archaeon]
MPRLQPVHGIPALSFGDAVVIADLHIGLESHLRSKGFHLVSRTDDMLGTLGRLSETHSRLIVLGDVKDAVPGRTKQESVEIPEFFRGLLDRFDRIDVVRGNHDTGLSDFLPDGVRLRPAKGFKVDGVGFVHGHRWPSEATMDSETLVMAHEHPAVMFRDGVGRVSTEPCWIRGRFLGTQDRYPRVPGDVIVVPAFNRMLGGSPANVVGGAFLSPILSDGLVDLDGCRLYLLDGVDLGPRSSLMVEGRDRGRWKK